MPNQPNADIEKVVRCSIGYKSSNKKAFLKWLLLQCNNNKRRKKNIYKFDNASNKNKIRIIRLKLGIVEYEAILFCNHFFFLLGGFTFFFLLFIVKSNNVWMKKKETIYKTVDNGMCLQKPISCLSIELWSQFIFQTKQQITTKNECAFLFYKMFHRKKVKKKCFYLHMPFSLNPNASLYAIKFSLFWIWKFERFAFFFYCDDIFCSASTSKI